MWKWVLLVSVAVGGANAFLPTAVNLTDVDVVDIMCPEQFTGESKDHEWITREGIRRNIREFFLAYPPATNPGLELPEGASLSQLFHLYYGADASPARFLRAVGAVATANIRMDSSYQLRYDPDLHADGEQLPDTQDRLEERYPQILSSILVEEAYSAARSLLGYSLHTIQKFYSHSTWVEQGNTGIVTGLGIPGFEFDNVAGASDDVCTPCPSPQGTCTGNVVDGAGLTSGYYFYTTEMDDGSDLLPKPTTGGKCSHGGSLDDTAEEPAEGGINKDTLSPCFSPHHHLHEEAAELAVQATQYYLDQILNSVGYDKYRRLFDLYIGTALSITIDTTGSMGDDIAAVKEQVAEIVATTSPEVYVLSAFNDPECGPAFKTTDGALFLEKVNELYASGGGDYPEMFWCGLQLALSETPDYGDVFCFTDAEGKDGERMDAVISQAQRQNNKVTVIVSGDIPNREAQDGTGADLDGRELVTGLDEYRRLTEATGGLLIESDKFDISDISDIMGSGVESATVTIIRMEVPDAVDTPVPIDNTIADFQLRISGDMTDGQLVDPTGKAYDLMDEAGLEAAGVEIVAYTSLFKALQWSSPAFGMWHLTATTTGNATYTVQATSTLDFLSKFAVLDPTPPHPHYRPVEGQPLLNTIYYLQVTLVGHLESKVALVDVAQFVDKAGNVLREIEYPAKLKEIQYLWTEPLPDHPFFVRLIGMLANGDVWVRLVPVEIWPVETAVELISTTDDLGAPPGGSATAQFMVINYGLESYFVITGTDDLGFLVSMDPERVFIGTNDSVIVKAHFQVPVDATVGSVSTVVVTARSETQSNSYNSALTHFIVLPLEEDVAKPTCKLASPPDCTGYDNNGLCSLQTWNVVATLQDVGSGLYVVSYEPDGDDVTVGGFAPGTKNEVTVDYTADCCTTEVVISGSDGRGNVGKCEIDMGPIGGIIYYFDVEVKGDTFLGVRWNITESSIPVLHYEFVINNEPSRYTPCHDLSCVDIFLYLEPCQIYNFTVTPVFEYEGAELKGLPAFTVDNTNAGEPGEPTNGHEVEATETTVTISWDPANPICSNDFEVCVYEVNTDPEGAICATTDVPYYTVTGLKECSAYMADVVALTPGGDKSTPLTFYFVTICVEVPFQAY